MAFTFCTNCGEKIDDSEARCPHCGHVRGQERRYTYGPETSGAFNSNESRQENGACGDNGSRPWRTPDGGYNPGGYNPNGFNQGGYNPNGYNPNGYGQPPFNRPPYVQPKRPISVGLLIFSIINIVFGCCCMVGMVFGIIGLVLTITAQSAPTEAQEINKKKTALVINIAGSVLMAVNVAAILIGFFAAGGLANLPLAFIL